MAHKNRSFTFTHTISRLPGSSCTNGIRAGNQADPKFDNFLTEHAGYIKALRSAGVDTTLLPALEAFPDSVFVEDAALCLPNVAIALRPGAPSRFGEADEIQPDLVRIFGSAINLPGPGSVDGGDIMLTDTEAFIGLSERTNQPGIDALRPILESNGYELRIVETPVNVLHFKSDCGLLDSETIFSTNRLAVSDCFDGYNVIEAPTGEEAAANLIRVNDYVLLRSGFPKTKELLTQNGYNVILLDLEEAAKLDGGLSCMSLRFSLTTR